MHTQLFIDGNYVPSSTKETYALLNPTSNEPLAEVSVGSPDDISTAVLAAHKAFPEWSALSQEKRSKILFRFVDIIKSKSSDLAWYECWNVGKIYQQCFGEIQRAAENIEFFATEALHQSDAVYYRESEFMGARVHTESVTKKIPYRRRWTNRSVEQPVRARHVEYRARSRIRKHCCS